VAGKSVSHRHRHSAWQRTERWQVYGSTGMTEVDRAMGSIYLRDPGVDRHHLILLSYQEIHNLSFPTFDLTCSYRNFVDPHGRRVSRLPTFFLHSSSQNSSVSQIPFRCRKWYGRVLMMSSLPSSFAISAHPPARDLISLSRASWPACRCFTFGVVTVPGSRHITRS
jgi:hypothetical protein